MEKDESDEIREMLRGVDMRSLEGMLFVSKVNEFVEMHDFLKDDDFAELLDLTLRCLTEPHMKSETARNLLIKFQAASVKYGTLAIFYTTLRKGRAGTEDNFKKNIYYSLSDLCDKMAQSLKYIVRRYGDE